MADRTYDRPRHLSLNCTKGLDISESMSQVERLRELISRHELAASFAC